MTLLEWLEQRYPTAKRQNLKRMVEAGRVRINGKAAGRLKDEIPDAAKVEVSDTPRAAAPPPPPDLEIIHEDLDLIVVSKPAGLPLAVTIVYTGLTDRLTLAMSAIRIGMPAALALMGIWPISEKAAGWPLTSANTRL